MRRKSAPRVPALLATLAPWTGPYMRSRRQIAGMREKDECFKPDRRPAKEEQRPLLGDPIEPLKFERTITGSLPRTNSAFCRCAKKCTKFKEEKESFETIQ
jgi:hypothetical protein